MWKFEVGQVLVKLCDFMNLHTTQTHLNTLSLIERSERVLNLTDNHKPYLSRGKISKIRTKIRRKNKIE